MKNRLKIFVSILFFCILIASTVFATSGILGGVSVSVQPSLDPGTAGTTDISRMGNDILGYVQFIGWGIAIGMLLYVGIKYMMASANEKANLKSGTINWITGALIIIAASTIFTIVTDIFKDSVS